MEQEVLYRLYVLFGALTLVGGWFAYRLVVKGICPCFCGPGKCACNCGCKNDCPCRTRRKTDGSDWPVGGDG